MYDPPDSLPMPSKGWKRLRRAVEFETVRAKGNKAVCAAFVLQIMESQTADTSESPERRFGVIASRRVGNAVRRNRAKRLFREVFRLNQEILPSSCDTVIVARRNFRDYSLVELEEQFRRLARRLTSKKDLSGLNKKQ